MVGAAGFEPAASRVQGGNSDRTELHPVMCWLAPRILKSRPLGYQPSALPLS